MRPRLASAACAAALLAAAGCGGSSKKPSATPSQTTSGQASLTTVSMVQDWPFPWAPWIPWLVADQKGWFRQAGIKLQIRIPGNVADPAKILSTGRADVAFTTILDVIEARAQGATIRAVGAYEQHNNWGMIFRQGDRTDLRGLKGKRIGIYNDAWTKAQLQLMLGSAGLKTSDVTLVPAPSDTGLLLLAKKVDATTGVTNGEQAEVDTIGKQHSSIVLGAEHGVPNSYVGVIAMNDGFREKHPDVARHFMGALRKGLQWSMAHPTQAVDIFLKRYPKALSRPQAVLAWRNTVKIVTSPQTTAHGLFWNDAAVWTTVSSTLKREGITDKTVPAKELFTNDLLGS